MRAGRLADVCVLAPAAAPRLAADTDAARMQCLSTAGTVPEQAFRRAVNQLKSSVLMNLELREVLCEDMGKQVRLAPCRARVQAGADGRCVCALCRC